MNYKRLGLQIIVFVFIGLIVFLYFSNPTPFKIIAKKQIELQNKRIDSLKNVIATYKPKIIYKHRKDSLKRVLEPLKQFNQDEKSNTYINSDIDGKFLLLANEIQKDTIRE